jgi:hypothetical protein
MNKKIILSLAVLCLLSAIFVPTLISAADDKKGIVPCDGVTDKCTLDMLGTMAGKIYNFIVIDIATPLAVLAITIGGILMLISAGNPNMLSLGKKIMYSAIIGLVLVWCSYLIINFILTTIGAKPLS